MPAEPGWGRVHDRAHRLVVPEHDGRAVVEGVGQHLLDRAGEPGEVSTVRPKHDIPALDEGPHVSIPGGLETGHQVDHADAVPAAHVDAAQQGHIGRIHAGAQDSGPRTNSCPLAALDLPHSRVPRFGPRARACGSSHCSMGGVRCAGDRWQGSTIAASVLLGWSSIDVAGQSPEATEPGDRAGAGDHHRSHDHGRGPRP